MLSYCITELFVELVLLSGTKRDEVDLYGVVPRNEELQREQNISFGQFEVFKCCYEDYKFSSISPMMSIFGNWTK